MKGEGLMIKRKIKEIASILFRCLIFPFKRMGIEAKTKSIMKQGSYMHGNSVLLGRNYVGKRTVLNHTTLGYGSYVSNDCDFTDTLIGRYTSIGTGVKTVLGSHPLDEHAALHPAFYSKEGALGYTYVGKNSYEEFKYVDEDKNVQVSIGNDVWIGNDVKVLGGVSIADGSVVGAGAVVTKDTVPYGIYAGVPATLIRKRYDDETIEALLNLKWWDKGEDWIKAHIDDFESVSSLIKK